MWIQGRSMSERTALDIGGKNKSFYMFATTKLAVNFFLQGRHLLTLGSQSLNMTSFPPPGNSFRHTWLKIADDLSPIGETRRVVLLRSIPN